MGSPETNFLNDSSIDELESLAEKYGTPYYLYDVDLIADRIAKVKQAFEGLVKVFYAVKTNPNLELLRSISSVADGMDVSSGGELEQVKLAGFPMRNVSFAGPAKTNQELEASVDCGVGCISIESTRELKEAIQLAKRLGQKASIVIRVNPKLTVKEFGLKMGGRPVQFGIDEEELPAIADEVERNANAVEFRGLHVYAGSLCFEPAGIEDGVLNTLRLVREIEMTSALRCTVVNFGGGFGVSNSEPDRELDVEELGRALVPKLREFQSSSDVDREFVFELGRYLATNAGMYVVRVISSKESRGKSFFMVDGGLHHHLAAAGMFGVGLRSNYVLQNLSRPQAPSVRCNLAGPLCNPTDLLGANVNLPKPEIGDLIGVMKSGSYAYTASPLLFLGRPTPAELIRRDGKIVLGRRSRTMVEFN